jgi:hypothetical protein
MGTPLEVGPRCVQMPPCDVCWYCRTWVDRAPLTERIHEVAARNARAEEKAGAPVMLFPGRLVPGWDAAAGTTAQKRVHPESGRPRRRTRGNR